MAQFLRIPTQFAPARAGPDRLCHGRGYGGTTLPLIDLRAAAARTLLRFQATETGASAAEYAILLASFGAAVLLGVLALGSAIKGSIGNSARCSRRSPLAARRAEIRPPPVGGTVALCGTPHGNGQGDNGNGGGKGKGTTATGTATAVPTAGPEGYVTIAPPVARGTGDRAYRTPGVWLSASGQEASFAGGAAAQLNTAQFKESVEAHQAM